MDGMGTTASASGLRWSKSVLENVWKSSLSDSTVPWNLLPLSHVFFPKDNRESEKIGGELQGRFLSGVFLGGENDFIS